MDHYGEGYYGRGPEGNHQGGFPPQHMQGRGFGAGMPGQYGNMVSTLQDRVRAWLAMRGLLLACWSNSTGNLAHGKRFCCVVDRLRIKRQLSYFSVVQGGSGFPAPGYGGHMQNMHMQPGFQPPNMSGRGGWNQGPMGRGGRGFQAGRGGRGGGRDGHPGRGNFQPSSGPGSVKQR
jgi:hypothetical protein